MQAQKTNVKPTGTEKIRSTKREGNLNMGGVAIRDLTYARGVDCNGKEKKRKGKRRPWSN